jgi:hypothetical protein
MSANALRCCNRERISPKGVNQGSVANDIMTYKSPERGIPKIPDNGLGQQIRVKPIRRKVPVAPSQ